ncbi:recombinase family protein [Donghicola sp.]|jgi:DNA invertase Pin-like site-specific DNA recombinase|uniref:recombinase family protein n=1 Tax=Donghicola sp. TaxID=1929294 RepID=UPI002600298F|nr:recombinase family protein [Donghicola sp.]MCT4576611.1 recombinase family protein [Donghicola sp.]
MKSYVVYRRVSTNEQGKSGLGLDAQDRDIRLYLESYSDQPFDVIEEFTEVASGSEDDRPELKRALDLARKHRAELLVAKLDRLSRKVSFIASLLEDRKVQLRVAAMPQADKFQLHIYAALAEQEREFISIRTKAALKEAKARGVKLGGARDKTLKRNQELQKRATERAQNIAGLILPLHESGKSLREIAAELNRAGVQTARGGNWQASQVKRTIDRLQR